MIPDEGFVEVNGIGLHYLLWRGIPNAGHLAPMERPDAVGEAILAFMET